MLVRVRRIGASHPPISSEADCLPTSIKAPNRQVCSVVLCVDLVASRRIWPATLDGSVDPDRSRQVWSDRLDDQTDNQGSQTAQALPVGGGASRNGGRADMLWIDGLGPEDSATTTQGLPVACRWLCMCT